MSATAEQRRERLVALYKEVSKCTKCPLHETRAKTVFGAGDADAELMFVGEAPGAEEDRQGLPFVGRAGQLLNQLLEEIGLSREQVFIANVLKSRPPGNRDPQPLEIEACKPYLFEQVRLIEPRVVCTLGNFATKLLSGSPVGITRVRGTPQVHELGGRTVFLLPLLHPAAALRTPAMKEQLREDLATVPELLRRPPPAPAPSAEEIAAAGEAAGAADPPPPPPEDQLDMFG
jgi:uracil-DNA glycosylase